MQTAEARPVPVQANHVLAVEHQPYVAENECSGKRLTQIRPGAKAVDNEPHVDATRCGGGQCRGDLTAGDVIGKDIGFDVNGTASVAYRADERGKVFRSIP